ncbi:MAG: NAD-dependent epimerase/dehydratase family protein [Rhodobacter sp.]|nr:NAD-dependent epimerase/dehydratase family protein [Paracoccaceae bacterium]MCB1410009.1 NAD-dependent epimerase/dehydratase family protein [Paracoccaceae bacterium]MCC0081701.1 NAD-dependent epimerase/dehydratase family protein [Rhodobacter sp.]
MSHPPPPLLIAGANGRVGRLLRRAGLGAHWAQRGPGADLDWPVLDGPGPLLDWCARHGRPRALLLLAGVTPGADAVFDRNRALGLAALEAAHRAGIGRVLLASSSAVYGRSNAAPWPEDAACDPPSAYGQAKLAMEQACAAPGVTMLRIGNVAGADALLTNPRRPLLLDRFADGAGPVRSYIGPQSLARVLEALVRAPALPPVLNVGAPRPVDMADLAQAAGLPLERRPAPPDAIARLTLATGRLETLVRFADTDSAAPGLIAQWRACQEPR